MIFEWVQPAHWRAAAPKQLYNPERFDFYCWVPQGRCPRTPANFCVQKFDKKLYFLAFRHERRGKDASRFVYSAAQTIQRY